MMPLLIELDLLVTFVVGCLVFTENDRTVLLEIEVCLFELVLGLKVTERLEVILVLLRFTEDVLGWLRTVVVVLNELLGLEDTGFLELTRDWDWMIRLLETVLLRLRLALDGL